MKSRCRVFCTVEGIGMVSARLRGATSRGVRSTRAFRLAIVLCLAASIYHLTSRKGAQLPSGLPQHTAIALEKCRLLDVQPGHPPDFHSRTQSDRFVEGTKPTLITVSTYVLRLLLSDKVLRGACTSRCATGASAMLWMKADIQFIERNDLDWRRRWSPSRTRRHSLG